jgi:N-acetylmuramoyl-L-alanine amidase
MADRRILAPPARLGRKFTPGRPTCIVIHSLEAPANRGMVHSLATGWMQTAPVSIHAIAGPDEVIDMVPLDTVAYHCGGGNFTSLGLELTGYAAWTFNQWISGDSKQGAKSGSFDALRNGARKVAEWCKALNIPMRWLTPSEVAAGARGLITHDTSRQAFGGTSHTDPGPGFPYAIFLRMVQDFAGATRQPDPTNQAPGEQVGGAEEDDMPFTAEELGRIVAGALQDPIAKEALQFNATRALQSDDGQAALVRATRDGAAAALRSEGVSGAGDTGRFVQAFRDAGILTPGVSDDQILNALKVALA